MLSSLSILTVGCSVSGANEETDNIAPDIGKRNSKNDKNDDDGDDDGNCKDVTDNSDVENVDERELVDSCVDDEGSAETDECRNDGNDSENKSEDELEHFTNDKLDGDDESSSDIEDETIKEMTEKNEEMREDFLVFVYCNV